MTDNRIGAFVDYVLYGIYRDRQDKKKLFLSMSRKSLTDVLGGSRLGPSQKKELRQTCAESGVGLSEIGERFYFFDPAEIVSISTEIDDLKNEIKASTDHFEKLYNSEAADEQYEMHQFPKAA
jgi:hypothetical protein